MSGSNGAQPTPIRMFRPHVGRDAIALVNEVLPSGWIGEGPLVLKFEAAVGAQIGASHCVAVNSGTSSLHLALKVSDIGEGDEVITTALTMLATSQAILAVGAKPVFADIEYRTGNIDVSDLERHLTPRTRAVLAVDWAGYPCDWNAILDFCGRHGLVAIDDAAHAFGAEYEGRPVGAVCPVTCFSFQSVKNLTTGDGGMLCLADPAQAQRARSLRWFGIDRAARQPSVLGEAEFDVTELGFKYHMNDIAAAIGLGNLTDFAAHQQRRAAIADRYSKELDNVGGVLLFERVPQRKSSHFLYCLHVQEREQFCRMMQAANIGTSVTNRRIDRFTLLGGQRADLPNLDKYDQTFISIPVHPWLTDDDVDRVVRAIRGGW